MRPYEPYSPYNQYNPYTNYMPGYNPCMDAPAYPYRMQPMSEGPGAQPMCPPGSTPYTVQDGDTLYSIARMFGSSVSAIMAANPSISDMSMIFTGQMLCIPGMASKPMPAPCPAGTMPYAVQEGDTLTSIAERFSVSVYALTVANPGFSAGGIIPGMQLCIAPVSCAPACMESERYRIGEGEDLEAVAQKFSVSTDALLAANPFAPPCYFAPGNVICLPAGALSGVPAKPNMPGEVGGVPAKPNVPNMPGEVGGIPAKPNMPNSQRSRR
jgi:LysM repeat protein